MFKLEKSSKKVDSYKW